MSLGVLEPIEQSLEAAEREMEDLSGRSVGQLPGRKSPHWRDQLSNWLKSTFPPKPAMDVRQSAYSRIKNQIDDLEPRLDQIVVEIVKERPELAPEALSLKNRVAAVWYSSRLLSPASIDHQEFNQCIRYVIESDIEDEAVTNILNNCWRQPELWFFHQPIKGLLMSKGLTKAREVALLERPAGSRGSLVQFANVPPVKAEFVQDLLRRFETDEQSNHDVALALGEWGGEGEARILAQRLLANLNNPDDHFIQSLLSAITNIGGPLAVETLLELVEKGPEDLATLALSNLEFLATGGSVALTEPPEPPSIDSPELRKAYTELAGDLARISASSTIGNYIRFKAGQLLQIIRLALRKS